LADLVLDNLRDRFSVANEDVLSDFVRLESESLIAKNSFSQRRSSPQTLLLIHPANSDKSIINNRLAWMCQFPPDKNLSLRPLKCPNRNLNHCLNDYLPIIASKNQTSDRRLNRVEL
jgi:hypothetical protein